MHHDVTRLRNLGIMASVDAGNARCRERIFEVLGGIPTGLRADSRSPESPAPTSLASSGRWSVRSGPFVEEVSTLTFVTGELHAVDGVLVVLDGARGVVESGEPSLREAFVRRLPCVAFIDDVGRPRDLEAMLDALEVDRGWTPLAVNLPWRDERGVHVIDVLEQRIVVESTAGGEHERRPVPASAMVAVRRLRQRIVEVCAEVDDTIHGASALGLEVGADELARALRQAVLARASRVLIVTSGSLRTGRGATLLLDALVTYLPSPADRPPPQEPVDHPAPPH